jgi:hypothetical protein
LARHPDNLTIEYVVELVERSRAPADAIAYR